MEARVRLVFDLDFVRRLYEHTMSCKLHAPTFEQRAALFGDDIDKWGTPQPDEEKLCPASLKLVKDQGVYLISPGRPGLLREGSKDHHQVCYAEGYDPDKDEDWDERSRDFSGDDFGDAVDAETIKNVLDANPDATHLIINATPKHYYFSAIRRKPQAAVSLVLVPEA